MRRLLTLLFLLVVGLVGCDKSKPVVVLDGWWNADYAKNACSHAKSWLTVACNYDDTTCRENMTIVEACVLDPVPKVRMFEAELATELAANPDCTGIQFVGWKGPNDASKSAGDALRKQHWLLGLDYIPGAQKQPWWMERSPDHNASVLGEGSPNEIARKVCAIVNQRGASLQ